MLSFLEISAVLLNLMYMWYAVKVKPLAWVFGSLAASASMLFFYLQGMPGSSVLNLIYLVQGVIGYFKWTEKGELIHQPSFRWKARSHVVAILLVQFLAASVIFLFRSLNYQEFNAPDIFLAFFSILATVLEIRKDIACWYYWIACNFSYAVLYLFFSEEPIYFYSFLMFMLGIYSIGGLRSWKKQLTVAK